MKELNIVHFNDVYEITPSVKEPVGGASRFMGRIAALKQEYSPFIVFSGDVFSPSVMSSITGGEHMVPVLNQIGIHVATVGNHDFDFGLKACKKLTAKTNFAPWMMANVQDADGKQLVDSMISSCFYFLFKT